jgi:hypothetical protein
MGRRTPESEDWSNVGVCCRESRQAAEHQLAMKFAKIVFTIAGIWGLLILTPLFFLFDRIGQLDPPPVTHPGFYYGFVTVGLAWQVAFLVIGRNPIRLRPIMIPAIVEKFGYAVAVTALYFQQRIKAPDMMFVATDTVLGILFVIAFVKTRSVQVQTGPSAH